jgi:hypothetical protein
VPEPRCSTFRKRSADLLNDVAQRVEIAFGKGASVLEGAALGRLDDLMPSRGKKRRKMMRRHPPQRIMHRWIGLVSGLIQGQDATSVSGMLDYQKAVPRFLTSRQTVKRLPAVDNPNLRWKLGWWRRLGLTRGGIGSAAKAEFVFDSDFMAILAAPKRK